MRMAELDQRTSLRQDGDQDQERRRPEGTTATKAVFILNDETESYWRDMIAGRNACDPQPPATAAKRAVQFGFSYHTARKLPPASLMKSSSASSSLATVPTSMTRWTASPCSAARAAPLSAVATACRTPNSQVHRDRARSKAQLKKWQASKDAPTRRLIEVIGDKDMLAITRDDAKQFREWWSTTVTEEDSDRGRCAERHQRAVGHDP